MNESTGSTEAGDPLPDEPPSRAGLSIAVSGCTADVLADLERAARHALAQQRIASGSLEIAVVDDAEMSRHHAQWLGDDSTTDALTFDLRDEDADDATVDGQLVVCEAVARRRAAAAGPDWRDGKGRSAS